MTLAVLFDFGLTLAFPPTFEELVRAAGVDLGREPGDVDAFIAAVYSVEDHPDVQAAEARRELSAAEHRAADMSYVIACNGDIELMEAFYERYVRPDTFAAYPDTKPVLDRLRSAGVKLGVLSNCGWDVRANLAHLGILDQFDAVTLSCEHGVAKPDPALFLIACERLGLEPRHVLMVGDNPTIDSGAAAAGLPTLILPPARAGHDRGLDLVVRLALEPVT